MERPWEERDRDFVQKPELKKKLNHLQSVEDVELEDKLQGMMAKADLVVWGGLLVCL